MGTTACNDAPVQPQSSTGEPQIAVVTALTRLARRIMAAEEEGRGVSNVGIGNASIGLLTLLRDLSLRP